MTTQTFCECFELGRPGIPKPWRRFYFGIDSNAFSDWFLARDIRNLREFVIWRYWYFRIRRSHRFSMRLWIHHWTWAPDLIPLHSSERHDLVKHHPILVGKQEKKERKEALNQTFPEELTNLILSFLNQRQRTFSYTNDRKLIQNNRLRYILSREYVDIPY